MEDAMETLMQMGYPEDRIKAALEATGEPVDIEKAADWLVRNGDENGQDQGSAGTVAKSYRCVDTGKVFRTLQDAQMYAEKTGNSNFEESDEVIAPLTEEEKKKKVEELRAKIREKQQEREEANKVREIKSEISRREEGQKMQQQREELEKMQRERDYAERKREKEVFQNEKERLRIEVAKDKAERAAESARNKGASLDEINAAYHAAYDKSIGKHSKKDSDKTPEEIMEHSAKLLSAYRVGGEGLTALQTLIKMISNIVTKPTETKFQQINLENDAFKKRVGSKMGGIAFLKACGFEQDESENKLILHSMNTDLLQKGIDILEASARAY